MFLCLGQPCEKPFRNLTFTLLLLPNFCGCFYTSTVCIGSLQLGYLVFFFFLSKIQGDQKNCPELKMSRDKNDQKHRRGGTTSLCLLQSNFRSFNQADIRQKGKYGHPDNHKCGIRKRYHAFMISSALIRYVESSSKTGTALSTVDPLLKLLGIVKARCNRIPIKNATFQSIYSLKRSVLQRSCTGMNTDPQSR